MSTDSVGFGVIGLGMGAGRAKLVHATEGARLVAVCESVRPAKLSNLACS